LNKSNSRAWLVIHSLESYNENKKMIGLGIKGRKKNVLPFIANEIKEGDFIVYYVKSAKQILGIFKILKKENQKIWKDKIFHFSIKPYMTPKQPIEFKKLLFKLDLFKHLSDIKKKWGASIHGTSNAIKELTLRDFDVVKKEIRKSNQKTSPKL